MSSLSENMQHKLVENDVKTQLWSNISSGYGVLGEKNCDFGHGEGVRGLNNGANICRVFYQGRKCLYESRCRFLHVRKNTDENVVINIQPGDHGPGVKKRCFGDGVNLRPASWRTRLCEKWKNTGDCLYGDTCYFAHGLAGLQRHGYYPMQSKTVPTTAKDGMEIGYEQNKDKTSKWNKFGKINGIYADWIDDMPITQGQELKL